jgi:branched-chain amino acid transport system ATP-binding protein
VFGCEGLSVHFGGVRAIDGISLTVHTGEVLGLIGPNGAGKTTLLNAMSRFTPPTAGRIFLDQIDVTKSTPEALVRAGVGRTFQHVAAFRTLSVYENVEVAALHAVRSRKDARMRTEEVLSLLALGRIAGLRAGEVAQGDQRRVGIARAIALKPRFLLLDEPAAGLNDYESRELVETIAMVRLKLGCGVLLIEHDMHVIMGACDRIHVLDSGKSLADGDPASIRADAAVIAAYLGTTATEAEAANR